MKRFSFIALLCLVSLSNYAQIRIENKLVLDSLKIRIKQIHAIIYRKAEKGLIPIYDNEGNKMDPSFIFPSCLNTNHNDCDSTRISPSKFKHLVFGYRKSFNPETLNTRLDIESIGFYYGLMISKVELSTIFYYIKFEHLKGTISDKDLEFMQCLSTAYHDFYYEEQNYAGAVTYENGFKTKARVVIDNKDFVAGEVQRSKQSLARGYKYALQFDTTGLEIVSKILFHQLNRENYNNHAYPVYVDPDFKTQVDRSAFNTELFSTISFNAIEMMEDCIIKSLSLDGQICKIDFGLFVYDDAKETKEETKADSPKTIKYYYLRPENLVDFLGKFQYRFLDNIFNF